MIRSHDGVELKVGDKVFVVYYWQRFAFHFIGKWQAEWSIQTIAAMDEQRITYTEPDENGFRESLIHGHVFVDGGQAFKQIQVAVDDQNLESRS